MDGQDGGTSMARLAAAKETVGELRDLVLAVLLHDAPRSEQKLYKLALSVTTNELLPLLKADGVNPGSRRFVTETFLQPVLLSLLLLMDNDDEGFRKRTFQTEAEALSDPPTDENEHYVSVAQRRFAAQVFFTLCHNENLPRFYVLAALYPLLDVTDNTLRHYNDGELQSGLPTDLFRTPRFACKRRVVVDVLNGILRGYGGVQALLNVLLLDDRVSDEYTKEAVVRLVTLVSTSCGDGFWSKTVGEGAHTVVFVCNVSREEELKLMFSQILSLATSAAIGSTQDCATSTATTAATGNAASEKEPAYRRMLRHKEAHMLPKETFEERLDLFIASFTHRFAHLPPRSESTRFAQAYRDFCVFNKHFLTPGFAALSLRSLNIAAHNPDEAVTEALCRVLSLVKGCVCGAGRSGLSVVLEATSPGLLNLCSSLAPYSTATGERAARSDQLPVLSESVTATTPSPTTPPYRNVLIEIFRSLSQLESMFPSIAVSLCRGTSGSGAKCMYVQTSSSERLKMLSVRGASANAVPSEQQDLSRPELQLMLCSGLAYVYSVAPVDLQALLFRRACQECASQQFSVDGVENEVARRESEAQPRPAALERNEMETSEASPLLRLVEHLCTSAEADAASVFGRASHISEVLSVLILLAPLSPLCMEWSARVASKLLEPKNFRVFVETLQHDETQTHTASELLLTLERVETDLQRYQRVVESSASRFSTLAHGQLGERTSAQDDAALLQPSIVAETTAAVVAAAMGVLEETRASVAASDSKVVTDGTSDGADTSAAILRRLQRAWAAASAELATAVDTQSATSATLALAPLQRSLEDANVMLRGARGVVDVDVGLQLVGGPVMMELLRVLYTMDDVCVTAQTIQCLLWIAMQRYDSDRSSLFAECLCTILQTRPPPAVEPAAAPTATRRAFRVSGKLWTRLRLAALEPIKLGRLKVRLLDVLLALCDYDTDNLTLRNVDGWVTQSRSAASLFQVLRDLAGSSEEEAVVQVAALHCIGHVTVALFPRVPLTLVCLLCEDVFKHTTIEMAKAACASMLSQIVSMLNERQQLSAVLQDVELAHVLRIASAMQHYTPLPMTPPQKHSDPLTLGKNLTAAAANVEADSNALHEQVIRAHGNAVVKVLHRASRQLIEEVD